jgi:uncharacterized protein
MTNRTTLRYSPSLFTARAAGVPPSAVRLAGGATSRLKRLHVGGDPGTIAAALARTVEATP